MAVAPMGHLCLVKRMVVEDLRSGKTTAEDASEQLRRELPPAEAPWTQQQRPNDEQSVIFNLLGAELELREQEELCGREICDSDILERQSVEPSAVRHLDLVSDLAMADAGGQPPPPEPLAQRGSGRGHMGLLVGAGFACLGVATMVATSTVGRGRGQQQEPPSVWRGGPV
jgi:hypothetical protein